MAGTTREQRRYARTDLSKPLEVELNSIGSEVKYQLLTHNISSNGLFLEFEHPSRFPFTKASILELRLNINDEQQLFFNGKITRIILEDDPEAKIHGPGLAIRIIQISPESSQELTNFISKIAAANKEASPPPVPSASE